MNLNTLFSKLAVPIFLTLIVFSILFSFYKYVVLKDFMYEIPKDSKMPEVIE